jgi:hypothetical protein
MRPRIFFLFIVSGFALVSLAGFALAGAAGKYSGSWTGAQSDGTIKISLTQAAKGDWTAEVSFTLGGDEVKCKTVSIKVDGDKLDLAYEFNVGGLQATSTVVGKFDGAKLEGSYSTKSSEGAPVDKGTFKTTLDK